MLAPLESDLLPTTPELVGRPILIDRYRDLGGPYAHTFGSLAVHPTKRRVYLGLSGSADPGHTNLWSLALDQDGKIIRKRRIVDMPSPPAFGTPRGVTQIAVDTQYNKLYLTVAPTTSAEEAPAGLAVHDLDDSGEPVGTPREYVTGIPSGANYALARHPTLPLLYLGGATDALVHVMRLDEEGEPIPPSTSMERVGEDALQRSSVQSLLVSPDGLHLYVGGEDSVESYALNASGQISSLETVLPLPNVQDTSTLHHTRLSLAGGALYRRAPAHPYGVTPPYLRTTIPLINGIPSHAILDDTRVLDIVADPRHDRVWELGVAPGSDALSGAMSTTNLRIRALALDPSGALNAVSEESSLPATNGFLGGVLGDGTPVFMVEPARSGENLTKDLIVRGTIVSGTTTEGPLSGTVAMELGAFMVGYAENRYIDVGAAGEWISPDVVLRNLPRQQAMFFNVTANAPITNMEIEIEVARDTPGKGSTLLKTMRTTVMGSRVTFRLPGYAMAPSADPAEGIELESDHARAVRDFAQTVGLAPTERPKIFPVGFYAAAGGEADLGELEAIADTIALLGCNTIMPSAWTGIPGKQVYDVFASRGVTRRSVSLYSPPSYFASDHALMNPDALDQWANETIDALLPPSLDRDVLSQVTIADEPGWYFPKTLNDIRDTPEKLADFHAYLETLGITPRDVGQLNWSTVAPIGKPLDVASMTLEQRKLLYWSMRFVTTDAVRGFTQATEAIRRAVGRPVPVLVNWNNANRSAYFYNEFPYAMENNQALAGPERGTGSVDWFSVGRASAHTLFSEDWLPDNWSDVWGFRTDVLRSAAMEGTSPDPERDGPTPMGSYLIPNTSGEQREGLSYKLFSMIGRGAKRVEYFNFGPSSMQSDGFSDNRRVFAPLAQANRRLAKIEHVAFSAEPERGSIALYAPEESLYFDEWPITEYVLEVEFIHRALMQMGYRMDIVDPFTVSSGDFARRGYKALYVTSPNVPQAAQEQIRAYIEEGGTVVFTPGAAAMDEYDTPSSILDEALGLAPRQRLRPSGALVYAARPTFFEAQADTVTFLDPTFGNGTLPVVGTVVSLNPTTAEVSATLQDGSAAITLNTYGAGTAIAFAFEPGAQHAARMPRSNLDSDRFADGEATLERHLVGAAAVLAGADKSVTLDREMVEPLRLNGPAGTAVVLLNWTNDTQRCLTVRVRDGARFSKVSSAELGPLQSRVIGTDREVTLDLATVDTLLFEP